MSIRNGKSTRRLQAELEHRTDVIRDTLDEAREFVFRLRDQLDEAQAFIVALDGRADTLEAFSGTVQQWRSGTVTPALQTLQEWRAGTVTPALQTLNQKNQQQDNRLDNLTSSGGTITARLTSLETRVTALENR